MLRDRAEANVPRPEIDELREQARRQSAEPILNPASRDPLSIAIHQRQRFATS